MARRKSNKKVKRSMWDHGMHFYCIHCLSGYSGDNIESMSAHFTYNHDKAPAMKPVSIKGSDYGKV